MERQHRNTIRGRPGAARRGPAGRVRPLLTALAGTLLALTLAVPPAGAADTADGRHWTASWGSAMTRPSEGLGPNWSEQGFEDQTLRQVVRIAAGGDAVRVRLSNAYGTTPLRIAGATVARSAGEAGVHPYSLRPLTFNGRLAGTVPPGGELVSDPAWLRARPLESLTVTLYLAEPTGPATFHPWAGATSYLADGDHRTDARGDAFTETTQSWYYLSGVDVLTRNRHTGTVATFGASITDGYGSTVDGNNRYPDELAEILAEDGPPQGVVNLGISGNRLLSDAPCLGEAGVTRFSRDLALHPGVHTVVVLEGINDIGATGTHPCVGNPPRITAQDLIEGHRELIRQGHELGITVIGATMLPYQGAAYYTEHGEQIRDEVNTWIRTSGAYDTVIDFDRLMADPENEDRIRPAYDCGDHLHPHDTGYRVMAEAVARVLR
ncbi:SGNH/GDSL hydrolase family protein [Streptomyces sp. YIM 98790]|uniref:SGNH/GDSL hydrolase family protein n=1 Tax=Streptomyces sp. YIM 98790 TaxID=2689077 RepID=UPI00140B9285|nr:SGNH/GDSL hydrolase family protein [Streptomyces sp. YIM 98790]